MLTCKSLTEGDAGAKPVRNTRRSSPARIFCCRRCSPAWRPRNCYAARQ